MEEYCECGYWRNRNTTQAYNALTSAEMITSRIMIATFNGNPQTTIISCYSPTNISDETEVKKFYQELISVTKQVSKHNLSHKLRCYTEISGPGKSRSNTREKISYFFYVSWYSHSAADTSHAFGALRSGWWMNGKVFTILNTSCLSEGSRIMAAKAMLVLVSLPSLFTWKRGWNKSTLKTGQIFEKVVWKRCKKVISQEYNFNEHFSYIYSDFMNISRLQCYFKVLWNI